MSGAAQSAVNVPTAESPPPARYPIGRLVGTKALIGFITITAMAVGVLPATLYLDRGTFWIALGVIVFFAAFATIRIRPNHLYAPTGWEFLAAGFAAVSQGAAVAFVTLMVYILVVGVAWVIGLVVGWFGGNFASDWSSGAWITAVAFGGLALPGTVTLTTKGLWQALFPPVAGHPTPFRGFIRSRVGKLALSLLLLGTAALVNFGVIRTAPHLSLWIWFFAAMGLFLITMQAWEASQKATAPRTFNSAEEVTEAMLRALGFLVVTQPRTGDPEIDPYLEGLDFVVSHEGRAFAMEVKEKGASDREDAHAVSSVAVAAHALAEAARKRNQPEVPFEPVLVLVGGAPSQSLSDFAVQQDVLVIRVLDRSQFHSSDSDESKLKARAEQYFSELLSDRSTPPPTEKASGSPQQFSLSRGPAAL